MDSVQFEKYFMDFEKGLFLILTKKNRFQDSLLKGQYDEKIVCLLLISIRHHSNIHLQDVFSFLISCLVVE